MDKDKQKPKHKSKQKDKHKDAKHINRITESYYNRFVSLFVDTKVHNTENMSKQFTNKINKFIETKTDFDPVQLNNRMYGEIARIITPLVQKFGYVVKNTIMLVTMPFSMAINEVISWFQVGIATKTFLHDVSSMDLDKVYNNVREPTYTVIEEIDRYYITNFNDESKIIWANIDFVSKIINSSLTSLINLIIIQLKESPQNKNLMDFIKLMEETKDEKIRMVSNNASNEFTSILFGSPNKGANNKSQKHRPRKGGKSRAFRRTFLRTRTRRRRHGTRRSQ